MPTINKLFNQLGLKTYVYVYHNFCQTPTFLNQLTHVILFRIFACDMNQQHHTHFAFFLIDSDCASFSSFLSDFVLHCCVEQQNSFLWTLFCSALVSSWPVNTVVSSSVTTILSVGRLGAGSLYLKEATVCWSVVGGIRLQKDHPLHSHFHSPSSSLSGSFCQQ